jgi:hypothetical protein
MATLNLQDGWHNTRHRGLATSSRWYLQIMELYRPSSNKEPIHVHANYMDIHDTSACMHIRSTHLAFKQAGQAANLPTRDEGKMCDLQHHVPCMSIWQRHEAAFTKIRQAKSRSETPLLGDVSTFTIACMDCYSTLIDKRQPHVPGFIKFLQALTGYTNVHARLWDYVHPYNTNASIQQHGKVHYQILHARIHHFIQHARRWEASKSLRDFNHTYVYDLATCVHVYDHPSTRMPRL